MYKKIKYILTALFMSFILLTGLKIGESVAVTNWDPDEPNGYVCTEVDGVCDPNWNVTECTWSSDGCSTDPVIPEESP